MFSEDGGATDGPYTFIAGVNNLDGGQGALVRRPALQPARLRLRQGEATAQLPAVYLGTAPRNIRPANVAFFTAPVVGTGREGADSVVYVAAMTRARMWGYLQSGLTRSLPTSATRPCPRHRAEAPASGHSANNGTITTPPDRRQQARPNNGDMMSTTNEGLRRVTAARLRLNLRHMQDHVQIWRETIADGRRHIRYSAATDGRSALSAETRQIEAQITKDYHRIEKGLALRSPRPRFGTDPAARLRRDVPRYKRLPDHDSTVAAHALSALEGLQRWHDHGEHSEGGPTKTPHAWSPPDAAEVEDFFRSRVSVRDFADAPLDPAVVRRAADLALFSPSVCNRQAWGVWSFHDPDAIARLAALQNGNAGFRDQIPCLLIVAVDTQLFAGAGERNQRWIDGGLYAMSLVWALHAYGAVSCMLNWSVDHVQTRRLREAAGIPDHMDVITMIAAGHAREGLRVARSPRRKVDEVLHSDQR
jgi:nitroreductase